MTDEELLARADAIAARAARWKFTVRDANDEQLLDRMQGAAREADADLPPIARALAAIEQTTQGAQQ